MKGKDFFDFNVNIKVGLNLKLIFFNYLSGSVYKQILIYILASGSGFFASATIESNVLEKANMFILTKEANEIDRSLKRQLMISTTTKESDDIMRGELAWQENGIFGDAKDELDIGEKNFPENTLIFQLGLNDNGKGLIGYL